MVKKSINYTIPEECNSGKRPEVACSSDLPKIIYKVNRFTENNQIAQFIFIGDYYSDLREILNSIEFNEPLVDNEINTLTETFGPNFQQILGMTNNYPKQFIPEFIETDDTLEKIKAKIQLHLDIGKYGTHMPGSRRQMPVSLQYIWAPNCYRVSKSTEVLIREMTLGFFYYYNLTSDELISFIDEMKDILFLSEQDGTNIAYGIPVEQIKTEIEKAELYLSEVSERTTPRRTRRLAEASTVEEYRHIDIYQINPFEGIPVDPTRIYEGDIFEGLFVRPNGDPTNTAILENQNDKILQDYQLTQSHTLNLLNLVDFLDYLKENTPFKSYLETPSATDEQNRIFKQFVNGFLRKYWPETPYPKEPDEQDTSNFKLEDFVRNYVTASDANLHKSLVTEKNKFAALVSRIEADRSKIAVINNTVIEQGIDFNECRVLEVVMHVNYSDRTKDFVDLLKIFDLFPLSTEVPHMKFRGETTEESFHKIYKGISDIIPKDELTRWVSDKPVKIKGDDPDVIRYTVFGRGLSFKVKLYDIPDNTPKYGTLIILRDGKIELKASWDETMNANLPEISSALEKFKEVIQAINKLPYHLQGIDRRKRLGLPDPDLFGNPFSNTKLTLINTSTSFTDPVEINFNELNELAQCFHNTYAAVIRTDITLVEIPGETPRIEPIDSTILQMRYKRISFYEEMSRYAKLIYDLKQQNRKISREAIATVLREEFAGMNLRQDEAKMITDANLTRKIKHPGIDIRVRRSEGTENYKIFILGARNLLQLSQVHFYVQQLLYLYRNSGLIENWNTILGQWREKGDCQVDFTSLQQTAPEISLKLELQQAEALKEDLGEEFEDLDLAAELLFGEEEEEEEEEVEPILTEEVVAPPKIPKRKVPEAPTPGRIDPLSRLSKADPELFPKGYAKLCQKSDYRQPMVISQKRKNILIEELKEEQKKIEAQLSAGEAVGNDLSAVKMKLKLFDDNHGFTCRNDNFYFCPLAFCYTCEQILMPEDVEEHRQMFGHQNIYLVDPKKRPKYSLDKGEFGHHEFVGFFEPGKHEDGLCMPCCFKKPKQKKATYEKCLNEQCLGKKDFVVEDEVETNPLYVINQDKRFIPRERYAYLPRDLNSLFNQERPGANSETVGGNIRTGMNFDYYLRKGMPSLISETQNSFLNAIGDILSPPLSGSELRDYLIEELTPDIFDRLLNGNLKVIFSDEKGETDPYANFVEYLANDYVNEDFLWDFVTMEEIILEDGFNLVIFDAVLNPNKSIKSIMLKCPVGYDLETLFQIDRPTLMIFKYREHYENIYRIYDDKSNLMEEKLVPPNSDFVKEIFTVYQDCFPMDDPEVAHTLRQFYQKTNLPDIPYETPLSAQETYDILETLVPMYSEDLEVIAQVVDGMNKASFLILKNGLKLPVKPSRIVTGLPIQDYYTDEELEELLAAEADERQPYFDTLPPFEETFALLYNLNQWSSELEEPLYTVPRMFITEETGEVITGILLANSLVIEVQSFPMSDLDNVKVDLKSGSLVATQVGVDLDEYRALLRDRSLLERNLVDRAIKSGTGNLAETRVIEANKALFEEETYQRLRFEFSRFVQTDEDLRDEIENIVEDVDQSISARRTVLYDLLLPVIRDLTTSVDGDNLDYLKNYVQPNVRIVCFEQSADKCLEDPHCRRVPGEDNCKLFVPEINLRTGRENITYYLHLLVDELVRHPFKRDEILGDQIDTYIRREVRQKRDDEILLFERDGAQRVKKVKRLYQRGIDYQEQWETHPEIAKIRDSVEQVMAEVPPRQLSGYWIDLIGAQTGLRYLHSGESRIFIYQMIARALTQRNILQGNTEVITDLDIKTQTWNYIDNDLSAEPTEPHRPGWQLFLHNIYDILSPGVTQVYTREIVKENFADLYRSPVHFLTYHELVLLSRIFQVKFIILRHRQFPGEVQEASPWIICFDTTQTISDWYILLYLDGFEKYNIIVDTSVNIPGSPFPYRYIFRQNDEYKQIPLPLFDKWWGHCPQDHQATIDVNNVTLIREPTVEPMLLQTVKTAHMYPVAPKIKQVTPPTAKLLTPKGTVVRPKIILRRAKKTKEPPVKQTVKKIKLVKKENETEGEIN